jgi:hypothetical protein
MPSERIKKLMPRQYPPELAWLRGIYGVDDKNEARIVAWAKTRGLRHSTKACCLHWIGRGRCGTEFCRENRNLHPWMDHVTGWTKNGKPALLLCQPHHLHQWMLRDIADAAERFGLKVAIHGDGWYGYGTIAIELTPKSEDKPV